MLFFDEPDTTDESYTPSSVCRQCYNYLLLWLNGGQHSIKYCKPVHWINRPRDHDKTNCYACVNYTFGLNTKAEKSKIYKATATATLPVIAPGTFVSPKPPSPDRETGMTGGMTGASGDSDHDLEPQLKSARVSSPEP